MRKVLITRLYMEFCGMCADGDLKMSTADGWSHTVIGYVTGDDPSEFIEVEIPNDLELQIEHSRHTNVSIRPQV